MKSQSLLLIPALMISSQLWAADPPASPVTVESVKQTAFTPTVDLVGSIYSQHNVKLTAGVAGRLDWVAEPGTFLQKGEAVAKLDQLPLKLQQAEQQAQLKRADINVKYLQRELARLKELRQTNSASAFQLDQTQSQYDLALADMEIARVKLQQLDDQLSRTHLLAPFDGVVTERLREAGGEVNRGELLASMLDTENLEARLYVPVKYLPFIKQGKEVLLKSAGQQLQAQVKAIIPAADMRSQSFELRVSLPRDINQYWTAGQLITASLPVQPPSQALTVHRDALILRRDGTYVVVIDEQNKAHREPVIVGEGHQEWVSIKQSNLKPGDRVAVRGAERLQEGQEVAITNS